MEQWLGLIQYIALQMLREVLREASRSGKTIEQLLSEAEERTNVNEDMANQILAKLQK